ncbi:hypothetical protein BKG58_19950 [Mycobacteroides abscessus subsp. abscessus]|uniref:hypothetical protein n=1 Tax=Mycobacteroides abscessus TaxID=36809 RepID=UPI00034B409D|nr:hypothetical protein [Mycobacteroides abscessus]OLT79704.1 hypothetical protein BKG58_19950 [Mycobacteroides abscessus subsp. abscessus]SHP95746.1 Uncharacterised protein [Mycobacteroides abscessus subsp. abscessus]SKO07109.1 Uncharacterised protein [Mycobacteroides abscessus subsp. abscessus]
MARFRRPTPSNVTASSDIQTTILRHIAALSGTVTKRLDAAAAADPQDRLAHLVAARTAERQIDAAVIELAAGAVLGGMPAAEASAKSGISTATLTRRMPPHLRALRGHHVVPDPEAPYGWKRAATVSRGLDHGFCADPTLCALNRSLSRSSSQ